MNVIELTPELLDLRDNLAKDTYNTLKKLNVILGPAKEETAKVDKKEREKDRAEGFNDDYWCNTDEEGLFPVTVSL